MSGLSSKSGMSFLSSKYGMSGLSSKSGMSFLSSKYGMSGLSSKSGLSGLSGLSGMSGLSGLYGLSGLIVCLSVFRSVCLPACLSACLPACLSACHSVSVGKLPLLSNEFNLPITISLKNVKNRYFLWAKNEPRDEKKIVALLDLWWGGGDGGGLFSNAFSFPFTPVVSLQQIHYSLFPKERKKISQ
jgi:hypothetical protein